MNYKNLILELREGIATLTINRPESLNSLNTQLLNEIHQALDEIDKSPDARVLIITGAGEKAFVAGADITELAKLNAISAKHFVANGHKTMSRLQSLPMPVIAAVNGFALGGGLELALSCDFIYASEKAKFGLPEITLGLIPGFGGTQRLARIIGKNLAKEMIFTGKMLTAGEALQLGFVNRIAAHDQLMGETIETARTIASKGRVSLNAAKQTINQGMDVDLKTACDIEINAFALCMACEDAKEGISAFLEKRKAEFKANLRG